MPLYRAELHCHCHGDPVDTYLRYTVFEAINQARRVGIDVLAITPHQQIFHHPEAVAYAWERGLLLLCGVEAEMNHRHLVVLNVEPGDLALEPTWDELRDLRARKPEVLVMAPHPFYPHPTCLGRFIDEHPDCIDAVEWCKLHVHWLPERVSPNLRAARWAHRQHKTLLACSDAHALPVIGRNTSTINAEALTPQAIASAVRAGCVTFHRRGLELGSLVLETTKAMASQPRHVGRWVKHAVRGRRGRA